MYAFGPGKPPYCVGCALAASGVRAPRPQVVAPRAPETRRLSRAERKAEKAARKLAAQQAKAEPQAQPLVPAPEPLTGIPIPPPPPAYTSAPDRELYEQTA